MVVIVVIKGMVANKIFILVWQVWQVTSIFLDPIFNNYHLSYFIGFWKWKKGVTRDKVPKEEPSDKRGSVIGGVDGLIGGIVGAVSV